MRDEATVWIGGELFEGTATITHHIPELDLSDTVVRLRHLSWESEFRMDIPDRVEYARIVQGHGHVVNVDITKTIEVTPDHGRFCLWGYRRGWVQIGSLEDWRAHHLRTRVSIPRCVVEAAA